MILSIPDDLQRDLEAEVAAGFATSVEALVEQGMREHLAWLAELRASIADAREEIRTTGGIPWEQVKAASLTRLAAHDDTD